MGYPQGFPWMVPKNCHVETYRKIARGNIWEHMGTTGNLWKPTVGTDHLFVGMHNPYCARLNIEIINKLPNVLIWGLSYRNLLS